MSRPFATSEEYREAVSRLGGMVHSREPDSVLREYFDGLCRAEEASGVFPAFGALRTTFRLEPPEAMCVALWLYLDASPLPPLTTGELLEHCRRIGKRSPGQILGRLFVAIGEKAVLHPLVADFLLDREPRLPEGMELTFPREAEILHTKELYDDITALLDAYMGKENSFPLAIALCGENGSGRRFLISQICRHIGATMLEVDLRTNPAIDDMLLAAEIYGSVICAEHAHQPEQIARIVDKTGFAFVLCGERQYPPESPGYTVFRREIPPPDAETQEKVLRAALENIPFDAAVIPKIGLHRLNIGQTKQFALRLKAESMASGSPIGEAVFQRISGEQNPLHIAGAMRLACAGTLDALALPDDLTRQLTELCAFVKMRDTVYKNWGFGVKIPWGRGISALFYGAPGTGKTMAAAALANEAGLPLMRVDISQMMSKYIGETQKSIGKVFDEAAKNDCILFFDEADALFARRTESSDAQDKYANAETAYLLQRMEGYDGVCILATNLLQNFDEAFRRRIGYMLHFPMPDQALREKIWRGIFPAQSPVEALDYGLLAQQLELSGASIKNCAVHAAYLAATNGSKITMSYILAGAKNEYQKLGKTFSPQISQLLSI